jgi:hypothetical protein
MKGLSVTGRCRLQCPICWDLKQVADSSDSDAIVLTCNHRRGVLLASRPGSISIEHWYLFPLPIGIMSEAG